MEDRELSLREYLYIIYKRKNALLTFFLAVAAGSLIVTFSTRPLYLATTKVLIEKSEPNNIAMMNFYYFPYDPEFYETQHQLIRSPSVAQRIVDMLALEQPAGGASQSDKGKGLLTSPGRWIKDAGSTFLRVLGIGKSGAKDEKPGDERSVTGERRVSQLAKAISSSIVVTPIKDSKMVNIGFVSDDPQMAARIVNAVPKAYLDEILEMRMNSSRYAMKWLTDKAAEERDKLEKSEQALREYMKNKDIIPLPADGKLPMIPDAAAETGSRLIAAEAKRKELEALVNAIREAGSNAEKAEAIPVIAGDPTVQSLRSQIMKAEQNIAELSRRYGRKHPAMITAEDDLKMLKEKRDAEIRRVSATVKTEYDLALANENSLRRLAAKARSETLNLSDKFVQYSVLKRETETNRELFDSIVKKIKEQGIIQDVQTINVWVIDKAEVPGRPFKPNTAKNILIGLVVGLIGGAGLAFFIEYLDNTVKSPEEVERRTGAPILGAVEFLSERDRNIEDTIVKEPQSAIAENYRIVRTSVLLSSADRPPKNILITSISPAEGKTITSINLATTITRSENSVLLIDGDLRRPRVHKIFGLDNSRGLSTYLSGTTDIPIMHPESVPALSVIPAGPIPPNPSELLGSRRMHELMDLIGSRYDVVIWDSAPLLTVTDSLVLSKLVDGTIIVVKAGVTTYDDINKGLKSLANMEAHVLGILVNALNVRTTSGYYRHYYGYYSASGDEA